MFKVHADKNGNIPYKVEISLPTIVAISLIVGEENRFYNKPNLDVQMIISDIINELGIERLCNMPFSDIEAIKLAYEQEKVIRNEAISYLSGEKRIPNRKEIQQSWSLYPIIIDENY